MNAQTTKSLICGIVLAIGIAMIISDVVKKAQEPEVLRCEPMPETH